MLGVVAAAAGALAVVLSTTTLPAHGQAPDDVGWWFALKSHAVPVAPPAPPNVPAGGLYVQQDPDGPAAVGAIRANVEGSTGVTLTLQAAQGSTTTLGAPVQACATTSPWQPELPAPGYWEDRPEPTKSCVPGTVSTDGAYVAFHLGSAFLSSGVLDVVLLPEDGAAPFAIAFDPPAPDSLKVETAPSTDDGSAYSPPPESSDVPSDASATLASPPFTVAGPTSASPATTAVPAVDQPVAVAPSLLDAVGGDADRGERVLSLTGASLLLVGWWLLSTRRTRGPRRVGGLSAEAAVPVAAVRTVGIGRFARPREGTASALR
ncbi:MAG: hypothetical protein V7636_1419 [Actinomycetota bacterium]|jgi:hypothetical protein